MGKRSDFERIERDFYPTPYEAVLPLIPHLDNLDYVEPCAGDGALVKHLHTHDRFVISASDIEPRGDLIDKLDVFDLKQCDGDGFITNPPWDRKILHSLIAHLVSLTDGPVWLLFDADWMHTKQATELLRGCRTIVSVGRVKWIPDSKMTGKDNAAWYEFRRGTWMTTFYGRT